tara:strand:+ start:58155 stop:58382 length:228 start_codon:yes stop_codon:yes gene_type:complete
MRRHPLLLGWANTEQDPCQMPLPAAILLIVGIVLNVIYILFSLPASYGVALNVTGIISILIGLIWWQIARQRGRR